jgi:hypothetical protein
VVTFLSDFGTADPYVGIVHGVILGIAPVARVVDLTHQVPPQAVSVGALLLRSAVDFFPDGTVHLAVVDPGVGGDRAPIIAVTDRAVLVGPDNGLLDSSARALGLREVRRISNDEIIRKPVSPTFHARDIFGPVAGHLAAGRPVEAVGPIADDLKSLPDSQPRDDGRTIAGRVVHVDHFGNLISDIPLRDVDGDVSVSVGDLRLDRVARTYEDVAPGALVALAGSWGTLEIACNGGSAAEVLGAGTGVAVTVRRAEPLS